MKDFQQSIEALEPPRGLPAETGKGIGEAGFVDKSGERTILSRQDPEIGNAHHPLCDDS